MDIRRQLMQKSSGSSSSMEPPPPFLIKTYELVDDASTNDTVSWSKANNSFVIWDPQNFTLHLLPKYFKHRNFSSFIRQLNTYGFRKVDSERWEFANEGFLRGRKNLLKNIRRKKMRIPQTQLANGELDQLKRDKQILMAELVELRQQQQTTKAYLEAMEDGLKRTEMKQQRITNFMAKAIRNPNFLQNLAQQKDLRREIEQEITKKRRRPIEQTSVTEAETCVQIEPFYYSQSAEQVTETENAQNPEEELAERGEKGVDEGFWKDLLNENGEEAEGLGILRVDGEEEEEEDVNVLSEQFGFLNSFPP